MDNNIVFRPARRYLLKLYLKSLLSAVFTFGIAIFVFFNVGFEAFPRTPFMLIGIIVLLIQIITWIVATIYYYSIGYEIRSDEIITRSGILTRTVKHVPFRTITNIATTRDLIDQIIGIGSLSIQTAGTGGIQPEEKLVGITDLNNLYEMVAKELRHYRNAMSPNQAESENPIDNGRVLLAILQELRAIRQELTNA